MTCMTLVNMHTCKHVIAHRTHRRLSGDTASILFIKSIIELNKIIVCFYISIPT